MRLNRKVSWKAPVLTGIAFAFLAGVATQTVLAQAPEASRPLSTATVSVDFGTEQGDLLRTERFNTWDNGDPKPELRAKDIAFLNEQGLHADLVRIGFSVSPEMCDLQAQSCDFSQVSWINDVSDLSESLVVHLTPSGLFSPDRKPSDTLPLLKLAIRELKEQVPNVDYIEAFNEPDFGNYVQPLRTGQQPRLQPEQLYQWYVPFYQAVNAVNEDLDPNDHIRVGGPTLMSFDHEGWMPAFLDGYAADRSPDKRLDFVSWHGYGYFDKNDGYRNHVFYKDDPSKVATQRSRLDAMLQERGITTYVPAFITETGIYPGPSFDEPNPSKNDWVRQAPGLAALHYWWARQPNTYPFNWTVRHNNEGRKDQLVTLRGENETTPTGTFTPYGNMLLMQSKMKDTQVKAVSDSLNSGLGIYAVASKDETGASVMVWNYQSVKDEAFRTTINMSGLPPQLRQGPVRQTVLRIDADTSNYWADPRKANLQQVDQKVVQPGRTYVETVNLKPNAVYLITMEPVNTGR